MFELQPLSPKAIDSALEKAERYRLLNEPWEAESICRDVLAVDENNQRAVTTMLLALTDRFSGEGVSVKEVRELADRLESEYERAYYNGIICERRGKSRLASNIMGTGPAVYDWLREAMDWFEKAKELRPAGNDDAILRWNTCARLIMHHKDVRPAPAERAETMLE